ncbi:MAG: hypothetical protein IKY96_07520 [Oscillospiraceae bacterium]|nr:hypothetical protein [Oscillospiraceae bacterium]
MAMSGRPFTGLLIANNQSPQSIQILRKKYQDLYIKLSPYQKVQSAVDMINSERRLLGGHGGTGEAVGSKLKKHW